MIKRNPDAAFGLLDYAMLPKINRLLRSYGIKLSTRSCYAEWGDQIEVSVVRLSGKPKRKRREA